MDDIIIPFKPMTDRDDIQDRYFTIPQVLIINPRYNLSPQALIIYSLLRNRRNLSKKNDWKDSQGIYIIFTREELAKLMRLSVSSLVKYFKELTAHGLINEVRRGLGKANKIYFGEIDTSEWSEELENLCRETDEGDENNMGKKTEAGDVNSRDCVFQSQLNSGTEDGSKVKTLRFPKSRDCVSQSQDIEILHSSNTDNNNTDKNKEIFANAKIVQAHPPKPSKVQSTLFSMPKATEAKAKPNTVKRALQDIEDAKSGILSWDNIKPRDFTYYYITKHNEVISEKIIVELKSSQVPNMKAFISNYSIPNEEVCMYLDELITSYSESIASKTGGALGLIKLGRNDKIVSSMMRSIRVKLAYAKEKPVLTEEEKKQLYKIDESEVF